MNFKQTIISEEINEAKKINTSSFLKKVSDYTSLDNALTELPDDYIEFYVDNEKSLQKALNNLFEAYNPETPGYLGVSKQDEIITKKIKYKGQILILTFDPEIGNWIALPGFRSITKALRYGKESIDKI